MTLASEASKNTTKKSSTVEVGFQEVEVNNQGRIIRILDFNPPDPWSRYRIEYRYEFTT